VERQTPDTRSNEIDLYIRTYYSLLRSTGEIRVRSLEEPHAYSLSSLHAGARNPEPDVAAFGYAAARLPECMPRIERVILGQSDAMFGAFGYSVARWTEVRARGRRRRLRHDGAGTLAAYISSTSDIDDLLPIITAYQIEWNKLHERLVPHGKTPAWEDEAQLQAALGLPPADLRRLREALGDDASSALAHVASRRLDLRVRLLAGSFSEYQRAAQLWWEGVEPVYLAGAEGERPPTYFVSSNTHALANLLGGYALAHRDELAEIARREMQLASLPLAAAESANGLYHALRIHLRADSRALEKVQHWDATSGIRSVENRAHVDVDAQVIELRRLRTERFDPRLDMPGLEALAGSDARIVNIDYPLGVGAYHLLSRVGQGVGRLLGVYLMGKAATLNAQVGDVMLSRVVHDEHSNNTYLIGNAFAAEAIAPYLRHGTVLDNQKAVTVRGPFLQNPNYLGVFYREGYTVLEMEAGPYLSALYECVDPRRHPQNEIVNLADRPSFECGLLHYASDTPNSRRQWLLSKSLGFFGMDATYACAIAITRRILERELMRLGAR
jgi:hypothetical protein